MRGHERQAVEELDQMSQALNRLRAMVGLPELFPANASPPGGRPRLDGVIGWSGILRGKRFGRRLTDRSR
jgi:hypothetical protein